MVTLNKRVLDPKATLALLDDLALELASVSHVTEGEKVADDLALDALRVRLGMLALDRAQDSDSAERDIEGLFAHGMDVPRQDTFLAGGRVSDRDVAQVLAMTWEQLCAFNGVDEYVASKLRTFIVELKAARLYDGRIVFDFPQDGDLLTPAQSKRVDLASRLRARLEDAGLDQVWIDEHLEEAGDEHTADCESCADLLGVMSGK